MYAKNIKSDPALLVFNHNGMKNAVCNIFEAKESAVLSMNPRKLKRLEIWRSFCFYLLVKSQGIIREKTMLFDK